MNKTLIAIDTNLRGCFQSNPCQHDCMLIYSDGSRETKRLSARDLITDEYYPHLINPRHFDSYAVLAVPGSIFQQHADELKLQKEEQLRNDKIIEDINIGEKCHKGLVCKHTVSIRYKSGRKSRSLLYSASDIIRDEIWSYVKDKKHFEYLKLLLKEEHQKDYSLYMTDFNL